MFAQLLRNWNNIRTKYGENAAKLCGFQRQYMLPGKNSHSVCLVLTHLVQITRSYHLIILDEFK